MMQIPDTLLPPAGSRQDDGDQHAAAAVCSVLGVGVVFIAFVVVHCSSKLMQYWSSTIDRQMADNYTVPYW